LATARSKVDGKDYMMAFSFTYGKGRIFHSPLGHDADAIRNSAVSELFRRGAAWAAGLSSEELKDPVDPRGKSKGKTIMKEEK
jgi:type 1 glutamine amidotransferase